jgi:hypothetical protein
LIPLKKFDLYPFLVTYVSLPLIDHKDHPEAPGPLLALIQVRVPLSHRLPIEPASLEEGAGHAADVIKGGIRVTCLGFLLVIEVKEVCVFLKDISLEGLDVLAMGRQGRSDGVILNELERIRKDI